MISAEKLRQYVERLENLEQQKAVLSEDMKEVLAEAKGDGFDPKILRAVLKLRKMKPNERQEQEELLHTYLQALSA